MPNSIIVDFHTHIYPDAIENFLPKIARGPLGDVLSVEAVNFVRRKARAWLSPWTYSLHRAQTMLRILPEPARFGLDELSGIAPLPGLLVESTPTDLQDAMAKSGIDYSVVIAHPPWASNEFILETAEANPNLIAAVNVPSGATRPAVKLKKYVDKGAKILKIHPAADGEGADSPRYKVLLKAAADLGLPVIIHTGCAHTHLMYKDPEQGHAERFIPWFQTYPETRFILAHMNFHEPQIALDLAEEYSNLYVDTSWQPAEVIGEAARRIGAERVLFGTDWPLVGNNISIGRHRIQDCLDTGLLSEKQSRQILGENAANLLGLKLHVS